MVLNGLTTIDSKFIAIGTKDIVMWTDGQPFVTPLNNESDFDANGFDYADFADMAVGDVRKASDYEGVMVIRMG